MVKKYKVTIIHNPRTTGNRAPSVEEYELWDTFMERIRHLQEFLEGAGTSSIERIEIDILD